MLLNVLRNPPLLNGVNLTKTLLIMKIVAILLLAACFQVSATGYSQKITLSKNNVSIKEIFRAIENQSGYQFFYKERLLKHSRNVSVNVENVSIEQVLDQCFQNQPLSYVVVDRIITIKFKTPENIIGRPDSAPAEPPPGLIKGVVRDKDDNPLAGVSVIISGTKRGTSTGSDGSFSIEAREGEQIEFSFVGYKKTSIPVNKKTNINIRLEAEMSVGDEVVVIGYGTQKKVNLTGAVDVVSSEDLQNRPAANVSQLMAGISPNLNINMSNRGGEPGAASSWNIRGIGSISGSSSPLILIDGVESSVDNLDPGSIESVSVLKDASASAIYGSRAPFGVVLITTKKGQKNKGVRIQYNDNFSWASPVRLPEFVDSYTWATAYNEAQANSGLVPVYPDAQVERIKEYIAGTYKGEYNLADPYKSMWRGRWDGNANYNWPSLFYKKNSFSQKHYINVDGGDEHTQYFMSAGFYNQGGLYRWGNDGYKRYNIMANVTSKVTDWLRFDFGARYARTGTDYPLGVVGTGRDYNQREFLSFAPMTPLHDSSGNVINPLVRAFQEGGRDQTVNNDLWLKLGGEIEPVKGWKTDISYNYNLQNSSNAQNPRPVPVIIPNGTMGNIGTATAGDVESMGSVNYYIFNALTSYEKKINAHAFKIMAGYEEELDNYKSLYGSKMNLVTPEVPSINAAVGATTLGATQGHWATQAVFGRLNYNFREKYLLEFSGRYNGSSRFAKDSRWGFFPSVSAGYNISKEHFWAPLSRYVNTLKIRGSYGSLGNQNVQNYLYLSTIVVNSNLNYVINNSRPVYAQAPRIISSDLTWETVTTFDLGIDAGLLNNRLNVTFDWYNRKTSSMLGPSRDLPAVLGTMAPAENNAELETKGFELSLDWKNRISRDFSYNLRLSVGNSRSKILKYNNDDKTIDTWYAGKDYGEIWGFITDGLIQKTGEPMPDQSKYYSSWGPGDIKYKDLDGNGVLNDGKRTVNDHGDLTVIGNSSPRYNISVSGGFNWKGFSFYMFWQGVLKRDYLPDVNANAFYGMTAYNSESSILKNSPALDYWRPSNETNILGPNTDAYFPKPYFTSEYFKNHQNQSRYVLNAAYVRLKNLQIGYTLPVSIAKRAFSKAVKIYVSGENLITLTKLPGSLDPETAIASDYSFGGLQPVSAIYPISRILSLGLNLTF